MRDQQNGFSLIVVIVAIAALALLAFAGWSWYQAEEAEEVEETAVATYTLAEVAEHNSADDCWLVIEGNVYDATDYLASHPPGAEPILRNCGQDATEGFAAVPAHSERAQNTLAGLKIGELEE